MKDFRLSSVPAAEGHLGFVSPKHVNRFGKLGCEALCLWVLKAAAAVAARHGTFKPTSVLIKIFDTASIGDDIDWRETYLDCRTGRRKLTIKLMASRRNGWWRKLARRLLRREAGFLRTWEICEASIEFNTREAAEAPPDFIRIAEMLGDWAGQAVHTSGRIGAAYYDAVPVTAKIEARISGMISTATDFLPPQQCPLVRLCAAKQPSWPRALIRKVCGVVGLMWPALTLHIMQCGAISSFVQFARTPENELEKVAEGEVKVVLMKWRPWIRLFGLVPVPIDHPEGVIPEPDADTTAAN